MDYLQVMKDLTGERCRKLQEPSYGNLTISIVILVGILVSYLPQHYRIIARRTSEGISPYFILLGTTSGTSGFANILTLPASRADVACCHQVSTFECATGLLGIAQVGAQWSCFAVILLLFLVFFPRNPVLPHASHLNSIQQEYTWRTAISVAFLCLLHGLAVMFITGWLFLARPEYLGHWANALGIMATVLAAIQYIPQILLTWSLGHVGSLSIPMMILQTPGSFVWSASLWMRLGLEGWSTWGIFLVTGSLQGCLLAMGIYFTIQARGTNKVVAPNNESARCVVGYISTTPEADTDDEGGAIVEDENTPLIDGQNGSRRSKRVTTRQASGKRSRSKSPTR